MTLLLVVEDDKDTRDNLREALEGNSYFVVTASDGAQALHLLQNHKATPDVIILDMVMPNVDGAEFLKRKRADPGLVGIPVILCTGMSAQRVRPECGEGDVLLVLPKPCSMKAIIQVLSHLRRTGHHRAYKPADEDE